MMTIEYMPIFIDYTLHLDDSLNCQKKKKKGKRNLPGNIISIDVS
jgi:hypothetical protein